MIIAIYTLIMAPAMFLVMFFVFMYALGTLNLLLGKHQFAFNAILELNAITVPSALGSLLLTGSLFRAFLLGN